MQVLNNLEKMPKGWKKVFLSEILSALETGKRPKGGVNGFPSGTPSIGAEHLTKEGTFNFAKIKYVPKAFAENMTRGRIKLNDILIVKDGATTAKTSFIKQNFPFEDAVINEHVFIYRAHFEINPKYIFFYLWSSEGQTKILKDFRGAAQGGISTSFIDLVDIPIAPCSEQNRIVNKIEQLFTKLDTAVDELKKAKAQIKRYRRVVLKSAFEGKLTEEWRIQNAQSVDLNLSSSINQIDQSSIPMGWKWFRIDEITQNHDGKRIPLSQKKRENFKGEYPYYGATGIVDYISDYIFDGEYILIGEDGANLLSKAKPLAFVVKGKFWVNNHAHVLRTTGNISQPYLTYYFMSLEIQNYVTGTAQPKLTQQNLNKIPVPLCSKEEQEKIVLEVERHFSIANESETLIERSFKQIERLRKSILKKAFEGKVVPQDPTDEPAEKLLERIRQTQNINKKVKTNTEDLFTSTILNQNTVADTIEEIKD